MGCSFESWKSITIIKTFQFFLGESGHKLNKMWVNKSKEFYNKSMKSWLQNNDTEIYSTYNEWKSVAETFVEY